jgi:type IV secretory pathway VirB2 component (pilin)
LARPRPSRAGRDKVEPMDRDARSELLQMMGLVAAVVAVVILVFFGLGYLFGRLFL